MTLYRQDVLALAALESQMAVAIRALNTGSQLIEINKTLYYAQSVSEIRAKRLTALAVNYPDDPAGGTPTPSPSPSPAPAPGDSMPPADPTGSYAATGNIVQVDFDLNTPRNPVAGWNPVYNDLQQQDTPAFTTTNGQATSIYKMARTANRSDANGFGEIANPADSGVIPDIIMSTNHSVLAGYTIDDMIGGLNPSYAYDVTFYGSRMEDTEYTLFRVGANSQILDVSHNTSRGVTFAKVRPSPLGIVYWSWQAAPSTDTTAGALAGMVLTEFAPA